MRKLLLIFALMLPVLFCSGADYDAPRKGHPRLYVTKADIPALKAKMRSEQGRQILMRMQELAQAPDTSSVPFGERDFRHYFRMHGLTSYSELLALDYLVNGNRKAGRTAIKITLDSLKRTDYGVKRDLSRANGVMLMVGAVVYDWCYDLLNAKQKAEFVEQFKRIASRMECGYPIHTVEQLAGHTCEWMIMRDMLSAGVAVYDEYPDMYNNAMDAIAGKLVPVRNYCYAAGNYHQGSKYLPTRYSAELFAQWIYKKAVGGGKLLFDENQSSLLYDVIYRMRPDGMPMPSGDENPSLKPREENFALPAMLASSFYQDPYLKGLYELNPNTISHSLLFDLLWNDSSLESKSPSDLPLVRYCPKPFGWMIARTGWDSSSVICEMKINENYAGNHQHLDGGSFQIYYKGALAVDSGIYEGTAGGYRSDHCFNYSKRTIAHNSLLVYNPDEKFAWYKARPQRNKPARYCDNDGGQRMPGPTGWDTAADMQALLSPEYTVGRTICHYESGDYSYLSGDITTAYTDKVSKVLRSFVFLNLHDAQTPALLLICDRMASRDASFKKIFLMHSIEEPMIEGNTYTISHDGGMLRCSVLYPSAPSVTKVGGKGHEFDVFGKNYPNSVKDDQTVECGAWRVEVSPSEPALEDVMLTMIQISDSGSDAVICPEMVQTRDDGMFVRVCGHDIVFGNNGEINIK